MPTFVSGKRMVLDCIRIFPRIISYRPSKLSCYPQRLGEAPKSFYLVPNFGLFFTTTKSWSSISSKCILRKKLQTAALNFGTWFKPMRESLPKRLCWNERGSCSSKRSTRLSWELRDQKLPMKTREARAGTCIQNPVKKLRRAWKWTTSKLRRRQMTRRSPSAARKTNGWSSRHKRLRHLSARQKFKSLKGNETETPFSWES